MSDFAATTAEAYSTEGAAIDLQDEAEATEPKAPRRRQPAPKAGGADVLGNFLTSREGRRCRRR